MPFKRVKSWNLQFFASGTRPSLLRMEDARAVSLFAEEACGP